MRKLDALAALALGLAIWQGLVWLTGAPHFILPSPARVAQAAYANASLIAENAVVTATEVALGLLIGTALGAITAIQLAGSKTLQRLILPILVFTQAVPVFALAPILTLWFGYGIASKIVMAVLIIYFPVTSAFYDGLTRVDSGLMDLARTMGASKGLGFLMLLANGRAKTDLMFASLITLAVMTVILHKAVGLLADRLSRYAEGRG